MPDRSNGDTASYVVTTDAHQDTLQDASEKLGFAMS